MRSKFVSLLFCLHMLLPELAAQDIPRRSPDLPKVIAASPNAASLGKYGNTPVNLYNGLPQINLPLYEVDLNGFTLPVTLSYHAEGIRVEEMASWAGLGWSLNAGGVITRTVKGIADEWPSTYGNYVATQQYLNNANISNNDKIVCLHEVAAGRTDTEPDIYFFNFGNHTGKFFLDENGTAYNIFPQQKIKIQYFSATQKWQLTTADGAIFVFGGGNESVEYNTNYNCSHSGNGFLECGATPQRVPNSWYLKEITTATNRKINFSYENYNYNFKTLVGETDYYPAIQPGMPCSQRNLFSYTRNQIEGCRLKLITFENGKIEFITPSATRADLPGEKRLTAIKIYALSNGTFSQVKSIDLYHDYFRAWGRTPSEGVMVEEQAAFFRLRLDSLKIFNSTAAPALYKFKYNETVNLPNRLDPVYGAYGQDHWGFFNNKINNTPGTSGKQYSLVPMFIQRYIDPATGGPAITTYEGADRSVDPVYANANTLTSIQYPTGGTTTFEYESNAIPLADMPPTELFKYFREQKGIGLSYIPGEPNEHIDSFSVASLEDGGVYANTYYETEYAELPCLETDIVADREIINAQTGQSLYYNPSAPTIFIPNGKYIIKMRQKDGYNCVSTSSFMLNWVEKRKIDENPNNPNIAVGGLRIARIMDYDGIDHGRDIIKTYHYKFFDSTRNVSSGAIVSYPIYVWNGYKERQKSVNVGFYDCEFEMRYSSSNYPLIKTNGSLVGYKNVAEETNKDRIEYTFQTAKDYPDVGDSYYFPFPSSTSFDWKRGLLRKEVQYSKEGTNLKKVKERTLDYAYFLTSSLNKRALGLKVGIGLANSDEVVDETSSPKYEFTTRTYDVISEWYGLIREEEILYDQLNQAQSVKTRKDYAYDSSSLKYAKVTLTDSRQGVISTFFKYPGNYNIPVSTVEPVALGIKKMQERYMFGVPVEQFRQRSNADGTGLRTIDAQFTSFRTDMSLPSAVYLWQNNGSFNFTPSVSGASGITKDPNYILRLSFLKYDSIGNILQQQKANDVQETYLWGYRNQYPVAKVVGSDYDTVKQFIINQGILNNPASDQQLRDELNRIRGGLAGVKALVSTYTYSPLVGITSETDTNGKTTYYEYDPLGRLKLAKDHNGKILKQYDYQYQKPVTQ